MFNGIESATQTHDTSTCSMDLRQNQEQKTNHRGNKFFSSAVPHWSVSAKTKIATKPILRQVEKLSAF